MPHYVALKSLPAGVIQDSAGNALAARQVRVYLHGTTTTVTVYPNADGSGTPLTQPLTTDSHGGVPGYVAAEQNLDIVDVLTGAADQAEAISAEDVAAAGGGSTVSSVFGRTGAVTAQTGDYTAAQVGADASGAAAAAQAAAIAASAQGLTPTAVKTAAYSAAAGDFVPVDISGGSLTVTLPNAPADKTRIGVKVIKVDGSHANAATVARAGSDVFNITGGSTSLTLSALFQGVLLQYSSSAGIWYVSTADTPIGQANGAGSLDATGRQPIAQSPLSVVSASPSAAPSFYYDNGAIGGNTNAPNMSIGGTMPNLANGAYSNFALGSAFGALGSPAVRGNLQAVTTGYNNTAIGAGTAPLVTTANTTTAVGADCFASLTSGNTNTGIGGGVGYKVTTGINNTGAGAFALNTITTQSNNTAVGATSQQYMVGAGNTSLGTSALTGAVAGATGDNNTAVGFDCLGNVTAATSNTAVGAFAMLQATTAQQNTAVGQGAARNITTGGQNTAVGYLALNTATTTGNNTAIGASALTAATTATFSTAVGSNALAAVTTGGNNAALGSNAGASLTTGANNTAVGNAALQHTITANSNTAIGDAAAQNLVDPSGSNTAVGLAALQGATSANVSNSTAIGADALAVVSTGASNTSVGAFSGIAVTTGASNSLLGQSAGRSLITGASNVCVGASSGFTTTTDQSHMTLLGAGTIGTGDGAVAIGRDSGGAAASAGANAIALGTANHTLTVLGNASIAGSGKTLGFYGATAIVRPSAVGTATGYAAGTTAATFHSDDTYTGNVGSTAYTLNGIVAALKNLGLITS